MKPLPQPKKIGSIQVGKPTPMPSRNPAIGLEQYSLDRLHGFQRAYAKAEDHDDWAKQRLAAIEAEIQRREAR